VDEPEGADPSATGCVVELIRTGSLVNSRLAAALRPHGLTEASFNVLMILDGSDRPLCPHEIGERRLVTRGTVTGVLDSLERNDLIRRSPHPADRRMLLIELTATGRRLLAQALPDVRAAEAEMMGGLDRSERSALRDLLRKAGGNIAWPQTS
jgi:DNA-binding MarR family transcriptional regulator